MYGVLLKRLTRSGLRKGMAGSTPWLVVGIVAAGLRLFQRIARDDEEVLYRTAVMPGDVFEIVTHPKR